MEDRIPIELLSELTERMEALKDTMKRPCVANMKERRQNPTTILPFPPQLRLPWRHKRPCLHSFVDGTFLTTVWDSILQPLDAALNRTSGHHVIYPVRLTAKCRYPGDPPHIDVITAAVRKLSRGVAWIPLASVLAVISNWSPNPHLTSKVAESQFFQDVFDVLHSPLSDSELRGRFDALWKDRSAVPDLSTKVVPQRGELRSFVADRDRVSHLVGSIMHAVFHPRDKRVRASLTYSKVWKIRGKNIINKKVKVGSSKFVTEQ